MKENEKLIMWAKFYPTYAKKYYMQYIFSPDSNKHVFLASLELEQCLSKRWRPKMQVILLERVSKKRFISVQ